MNYDKLIYESKPVKFQDYISNKYDIVHNELYKDALYNYLKDRIYNLLVKQVLFQLLSKFNNFITQYNDVNQILNFDHIPLNNNEFKIIEYENITDDMLTFEGNESNFVFELLESIKEDHNCKSIIDAFKTLDFQEDEQEQYIKFIIVNVLVLLHTCESNILNIANITSISNFIIRYDNSIYMVDENSEFFLSDEEIPNAIFIYEDMIKDDYHIGYTSNGKWILDIDPSINIQDIFDELQLIMNKTNDDLIQIATLNMIDRFLQKHKIIEKKNNEYWKPSSIVIYSTEYPYSKAIIDLSEWWNLNQKYNDLIISDIKILEDNINDYQIEDIDYVRGKVKLYSKLNDIYHDVDFNYVKEDTEINDSFVKNTFVSKIKNLYL